MKYAGVFILFLCSSVQLFAIKITNLADINGNESIITEIDLSNKGIVEFPEEILKCKNLEKLTICKNGFVKIPHKLSQLDHLKHLDLSENQNISLVDLEEIFDKAVFQLEELYLADCALFYLPEEIAQQKGLLKLDISKNYIKVLPYGMMHMSKLEYANFSQNQLKNISWLSSQWWALKELDVSGNPDLEVEGLLINLSYLDELEKLTISDLSIIPSEFKNFMGSEIVIRNSNVNDFPRYENSGRLKRITFEDCVFPHPNKVIASINGLANPEKITFRKMEHKQLRPFLNLNVDSLDLRENHLTNINPITDMKKVKWVDVRSNSIEKASLNYVAEQRPDIDLLVSEQISESIGIAPPFPGFEPKPISVKVPGDKPTTLSLGKTVFDIPKDAFLTGSGEVYNGPVEVEYTEYFTPEDIFFSGISMTTNSDGEPYLLSSGGMFRFEAKDENGNSLQANPTQPIEANVISGSSNPDMQTWKMDSNGAWVDYGANRMNEIFKLDQSKLDSIMKLDYEEIYPANVVYVKERFVPVIKNGSKLGDFEIHFDKYRTNEVYHGKKVQLDEDGNVQICTREYHSELLAQTILEFDGDSSDYYKAFFEQLRDKCVSTYRKLKVAKRSGVKYYSNDGPNFISKLKLTPDYENDNFDLTFNYKDSLVNVPVVLKTKSNNHLTRPKEITRKFTRYQYGYKKYIREKRRNSLKIRPFIQRRKKQIRERALEAEKNRQRMMWNQANAGKVMLNIGSVKRTIEMDGFGLWNCDVKARMVMPTEMASTFIKTSGEEVEDDLVKVTIIDKSQNGVINFQEGEAKFYDRNSKNVFILFFASVGIGVCRTWIDVVKGNKMEIKLLDPESAEEEISNLISSDS